MNMAAANTPHDQRASSHYRADIDGLRAIAVLTITAFHLGFRSVPGGYVGVDVFFVISGYLIGGIVLRERRQGVFSLARFYERRFRRILPALFVMLSATLLASLFVLFPRALVKLAESGAAAMLSVSNLYFWATTGYFEAAASSKPLLHTWSLAVEEQFYLAFPLLLLVGTKFRLHMSWLLAGTAAASFGLALILVERAPAAAFYLLPTRAWELLLGVLIAEWTSPLLARRWLREMVAAAGLAAIAIATLWFTEHTRFPGWPALVPCLGTAALLAAGAHGRSVATQALSIRPLVFFGLISYSLYLWHWPVIVLMREGMPVAWLRLPDRFVALALIIALASLSWRFVERPFRARGSGARTVFARAGAGAAALVAACIALIAAAGLPQRFDPQIVALSEFDSRAAPAAGQERCFVGPDVPLADFTERQCLTRATDRPTVLVVGDSHALHLVGGLQATFPGVHFTLATASGCRMTIDGAANETATCRTFRQRIFAKLGTAYRPDAVVLSQFWSHDAVDPAAKTLMWLRAHGVQPILAGPVVCYEVPLPQALAIAQQRGDPSVMDRVRIPDTPTLDARLAATAARLRVPYMPVYGSLCPGGRCITRTAAGVPVQWDSAHLSDAGSRLVARAFPIAAVPVTGRRVR